MKKIIHNDHNLNDSDINNVVKRAKLLIINDKDEFLMAKTFDCYHILGGHVENDENDEKTIERELMEEAGINLSLPKLVPFLSIRYYTKDYPTGKNTLFINNYYSYSGNLSPNFDKMNLTKDEKTWDFVPTYVKSYKALDMLKECYEVCKNKNVLNDTIDALNEYFNGVSLYTPKLDDYWYEKKLDMDPKTMEYNRGYDIKNPYYNYDDGTIIFNEDRWKEMHDRRKNNNEFFAYIKTNSDKKYVGTCNYKYDKESNRYECGVVIQHSKRGNGYSKLALQLLCNHAFNNGVDELYDKFELDRKEALNLFLSVGFKVDKQTKWKKFGKDVDGVVVKIEKQDFYRKLYE